MEDYITDKTFEGTGPTLEAAIKDAKKKVLNSFFLNNFNGFIENYEFFNKKDFMSSEDEIEKILLNPYLTKWPVEGDGILMISTDQNDITVTIESFKIYIDNIKKYLANSGVFGCKNGLAWPCAEKGEVIKLPSHIFLKEKSNPASKWNGQLAAFGVSKDAKGEEVSFHVKPQTYVMLAEVEGEFFKVHILTGDHKGKSGFASKFDLALCDEDCRQVYIFEQKVDQFKPELKKNEDVFQNNHQSANLLNLPDIKLFQDSLETIHPLTHIVAIPNIVETLDDAVFSKKDRLMLFTSDDAEGISTINNRNAAIPISDGSLVSIIKQNVTPPKTLLKSIWTNNKTNKRKLLRKLKLSRREKAEIKLESLYGSFHLVSIFQGTTIGYVWAPYLKKINTPDQKYLEIPNKIIKKTDAPVRLQVDNISDWTSREVGLPYTHLTTSEDHYDDLSHVEYRVHVQLKGVLNYNNAPTVFNNIFKASGASQILSFYGKEYDYLDQKFLNIINVFYGKQDALNNNLTQVLSKIIEINIDTNNDTVKALVSVPARFVEAFPPAVGRFNYENEIQALQDAGKNPLVALKDELNTTEWWELFLSKAESLGEKEEKINNIINTLKNSPRFNNKRVYFTARFDNISAMTYALSSLESPMLHYDKEIKKSNMKVRKAVFGDEEIAGPLSKKLSSGIPLKLSSYPERLYDYYHIYLGGILAINDITSMEEQNNGYIEFGFDVNYNLLYLIFNGKRLKIGSSYYLKNDPFNDPTLNAFVHRSQDILKQWEGEPDTNRTNWISWCREWVYPMGEIQPSTSSSKFEELPEEIRNPNEEKKLKTQEEIEQENRNLKNASRMNQIAKKSSKEIYTTYDRNLTSWNKVSKKINSIQNAYEYLLNNTDVKLLAEVLVRCYLERDLSDTEELFLKHGFASLLEDEEGNPNAYILYINEMREIIPEECMLLLLKNIFIIDVDKLPKENASTPGTATNEDGSPLGDWKISGVAGNIEPYVYLTEGPESPSTLKIDLSDLQIKAAPVHLNPSAASDTLFALEDKSVVLDQQTPGLVNEWTEIKVETPENFKGKIGFIKNQYITNFIAEDTVLLEEGAQFEKLEALDQGVATLWKIKVKSGIHINKIGWIKTEYVESTNEDDNDKDLNKVILKQGDIDGNNGLVSEVKIWQEYLNTPRQAGGPQKKQGKNTEGADLIADGVFGQKTAKATANVLRGEGDTAYFEPNVRVRDYNKATIQQTNKAKEILNKPLSDIQKDIFLPSPIAPLGQATLAPPGFFTGKASTCDYSYVELLRATKELELAEVRLKGVWGYWDDPGQAEKNEAQLHLEIIDLKKKVATLKAKYASCMQQYDIRTVGDEKEFIASKDSNTEQIILQASYGIFNAGDQCKEEYDALLETLDDIPMWPGTAYANEEQLKAFTSWIKCTQSKVNTTSEELKKSYRSSGNLKIDYSSLSDNRKDMTMPFPTDAKGLLKYIILYQDLPVNVSLKDDAARLAVVTLQSGTCASEIEKFIDWIISKVAPRKPALNAIVKAITSAALLLADYKTGNSPSFSSFVTKKLGVMKVDMTGDEAREEIRKRLASVAKQVVLQTLKEMLREISEICENNNKSSNDADVPLIDNVAPDLAAKLKDLIDEYGIDLSSELGDEKPTLPATSGGFFDIIEFINKITRGLSVQQKCNLVNGRYSDALFQKIRSNIKFYYPEKIQRYFSVDYIMRSFFDDVSPLIGTAICDEGSSKDNENYPEKINSLEGLCTDADLYDQKKEDLVSSGLNPEMADWAIEQETNAALERILELSSLINEPENFVDSRTPEPCELVNQNFKNSPRIRRGIEGVLAAATEGTELAFSNEAAYVVPYYTTPISSQIKLPDLAVLNQILNDDGNIDIEKMEELGKSNESNTSVFASAIGSVLGSPLEDGLDKELLKGIPSLASLTPLQALKDILTDPSISITKAANTNLKFSFGDIIEYTPGQSPAAANTNTTLIKDMPSAALNPVSYRVEQREPLTPDVETYLNLKGFKFEKTVENVSSQSRYLVYNMWERFKKDYKNQISDNVLNSSEEDFKLTIRNLHLTATETSMRRFAEAIAESKFFEIENLQSVKFIPNEKDLLEMCSKPEVFDLDVDLMGFKTTVQESIERFFEINDFCNEPQSPSLDPTSQVLLEASINLFIRACILDTFFVGIFAFSKFDLELTLKDPIIKNYFYIEFRNSLGLVSATSRKTPAQQRFHETNLYSRFKDEAQKIVFQRKENGESIPAMSKVDCLKFLFAEQIEVVSPILKTLTKINGIAAKEAFFQELITGTIPAVGRLRMKNNNAVAGEGVYTEAKSEGNLIVAKPRFVTNGGTWKYGVKSLDGGFYLEKYLFIQDVLDENGNSKWDEIIAKDISLPEGSIPEHVDFLQYYYDKPGIEKGYRRGEWLKGYVRIDDWEDYIEFLATIGEKYNLSQDTREAIDKLLASPWSEYFNIKIGLRMIYTKAPHKVKLATLDIPGSQAPEEGVIDKMLNEGTHLDGGFSSWRVAEKEPKQYIYTYPLCEMNTAQYTDTWFSYKKDNDLTQYGEGVVYKGDPWKIIHFRSANKNSSGLSAALNKYKNRETLKDLFFETPQFQAIYTLGIPFEDHQAMAILYSMLEARKNLIAKDFLIHTKLTIKSMFDMSLGGDKIDYNDLAANNVELGKPIDPDSDTMNSIWPVIAKFIFKTPLMILKGVTEIVDPNIKTTKAIYEGINTAAKKVKEQTLKNIKEDYDTYKESAGEDADTFEEWAKSKGVSIPDPSINIPPELAPVIALALLPSALPYGVGFPPPPIGPGFGPPMTPFAIPYLGLGLVSDDFIKGIGSNPNNKEQDDGEIICDTPYKNALEQLPEPEQDSDDESDIF